MRCVIDELFTSTGTKTTTLHEDAHFSTSQHPDHKAAQSLHLFVKMKNGGCAGACYPLSATGGLTRRALG